MCVCVCVRVCGVPLSFPLPLSVSLTNLLPLHPPSPLTSGQAYGGFLLHICVGDAQGVQVGCKVRPMVNYDVRAKIAPNHTMTHVLNHALRQVLGAQVDQRGSHVAEEKLRFDFTSRKAMTAAQLKDTEALVNGVISAALPVHTQVVALEKAMGVSGLRAVFGETYPDPVRVVSIGPSIPELLAAPAHDQWEKFSVELCGGTHLANTSEAGACCIVDESSIAKGVRRISAITGFAAQQALQRGQQLQEQVRQCQNQLAALEVPEGHAGGLGLAADALEVQVLALKEQLDLATVSQAVKSSLRLAIDELQKALASKKKASLLADTDAAIQKVLVEAHRQVSNEGDVLQVQGGVQGLVLEADIGSDPRAVKRLTDALKSTTAGHGAGFGPDVSFLVLSRDAEGGGGRLSVFASVSEKGLQAGLQANSWVAAAVASSGGKGGGKAATARGSAPGAGKDTVDAVAAAARAYASAPTPAN